MDMTSAIIALAVALVMGIGTIGPALGQGNASAKALEGMSAGSGRRNTDNADYCSCFYGGADNLRPSDSFYAAHENVR